MVTQEGGSVPTSQSKGTKLRVIGLATADGTKSQAAPRTTDQFRLAVLFIVIFSTCAMSSAATSRLYPPNDNETGGLRLVQVVELATRDQILKLGVNLKYLYASGVKDTDLKDGSVAMAIVYCCHLATEERTAIGFYVPPDVQVKVGDLVTVRMGRKQTKKDPGTVNVAVEVREHEDTPTPLCSWNPPNDKLWLRVLYCSWMPAEGWTHKKSFLHEAWFKPASTR
jgi:hypothetical protein